MPGEITDIAEAEVAAFPFAKMAPPNKKIQITSELDISSETLFEKITDNSTGETKVINKQKPHQRSKTTTVTTNPVKCEAKGTEEPHVTEGKAVDINPATIGYDTSQL